MKEVVGRPIAFASTGEKLADFDLFHPDRLAGRILGMGDMLTLIEKAEQVYEKDEAEKAATKLFEGDFTFEDFLDQLQQVRKMGPLGNLVGLIPGLPKEIKNQEIDEGEINRIEAIIRSMTPIERANPTMIDGSRRSRIAAGSGMQPGDVSALVKQFQDVKKMMQKMGNIPGLGRKMKKGKGKAKAGGRVTPKGTKPSGLQAAALHDPGHRRRQLPGIELTGRDRADLPVP